MCVYTLSYNNEVIYVGSSVNIRSRIMKHRDCYDGKSYTKMILYDFWRTVPFTDVVLTVIDDVTDKIEGRIIEEAYRAKHKPLYNKYRAHRGEPKDEYMRNWKAANRASINISNAKYYQKNKIVIREKAQNTRKYEAWMKSFSGL